MGKSSSSSKKTKRSKDSSKLRSVNKKKTKRNKSNKIRRIKDYSDESESTASDSSLYSSSSDDDYRRQKRRSKASKKRYSSSESDDHDDDTRLLKKKKRSKRKGEHVGTKKKKISSRKRRKRVLSSTSSDSRSIGDSQSDDGSESDRKRRTRDRGRLGEVKATRRRSKDGSEEDSEPDECWKMEDEVMTEKNSRRLKSIIVVSYSYDKDEGKEEDMVDDQDVYLRHGGNRELGHDGESDTDSGRKTVSYDEFGEDNKSETSKAFHQDNSLKDDDLEAILKKRALENLKRFRGETQRSGIARKELPSVAEGELRQIESEKTKESQDHGLMEQTKLCVSTDSRDFEDSEKILHEVDNVSESGTVIPDIASQQSGDTVKVKVSSGISSCSSKRKLIRPVLGQQESSLNLASGKEAAGREDAEEERINGSTIDKNYPESTLALATKNGGENMEPTKVSSTFNAQSSSHADAGALDETRESQSEQKTSGEAKDESQYEQKTMTVMRGGEMVQVSYKVYIPKKTSSLGRRKLKR